MENYKNTFGLDIGIGSVGSAVSDGDNILYMGTHVFNPANEAAAKIARKLEEGRRRVAAQKQSGEDNSNKSVFSQYLSILSVNFHKTLKEVSELTVSQVYDLIERYALFESYDLDIRSRLAGAKPDEQPED